MVSSDYKLCERDVIAQLQALIAVGAKPATMLLAIQCGDHRGKAAALKRENILRVRHSRKVRS